MISIVAITISQHRKHNSEIEPKIEIGRVLVLVMFQKVLLHPYTLGRRMEISNHGLWTKRPG